MRLASDILTETLPAYRVVFEGWLALMAPDGVELNQLQFVDIFLAASH